MGASTVNGVWAVLASCGLVVDCDFGLRHTRFGSRTPSDFGLRRHQQIGTATTYGAPTHWHLIAADIGAECSSHAFENLLASNTVAILLALQM